MMFNSMARRIGAVLCLASCLALASCASSPSASETFAAPKTGPEQSRYETFVSTVLEDDHVSRPEAEQSIHMLAQCYEDHELMGELTYDLDTGVWATQKITLIDAAVPPDNGESPSQKHERWENALKQRESQCAMFNRISDWLTAHADWKTYQRNEYEDRTACIRTNAGSYADRIDPNWRGEDDGNVKLFETFMPIVMAGGSGEDFEGLKGCMTQTSANATTVSFGRQ